MTKAAAAPDFVRSKKETAERLGISVQTLDRMRDQLPRIKISERRVGFRDFDIAKFITARTHAA